MRGSVVAPPAACTSSGVATAMWRDILQPRHPVKDGCTSRGRECRIIAGSLYGRQAGLLNYIVLFFILFCFLL